jgi:hypothetical protein
MGFGSRHVRSAVLNTSQSPLRGMLLANRIRRLEHGAPSAFSHDPHRRALAGLCQQQIVVTRAERKLRSGQFSHIHPELG